MKRTLTAIVPAAGRGTRFGAARNKVLEPLLGRPVLRWTLEALDACPDVDAIVVAASADDFTLVRDMCGTLSTPCQVTTGGDTRQNSVRNALAEVDSEFVAVHDAARPLLRSDVIGRCVDTLRRYGTAVAAVPVADTLKSAPDGVVVRTVERSGLWAAQTPQCARTDLLRAAYDTADRENFAGTDEASLLEHAGYRVHLVPGSTSNFKITTPEDMLMAETVLSGLGQAENPEPPPQRVGFGYDIHRIAASRPMILGGVDFHLDYGLLGHSDADALTHAVMDALLGAAGLPDIGHLFPNTDERWRDARSVDLLQEVARRVRDAGYRVGNVDATVIAERPKIAPHVEEMRANLASAMNIHTSAVGLKATTAEGLGSLGAGQGVAAHAVCILFRM